MLALLGVLLLRQVLIPQPAAIVCYVPARVLVLEDRRLRGAGECLLIEGVGDGLADRERDGPVLQNPLDIQVKGLRSLPQARNRSIRCHGRRMPPATDRHRAHLLPLRRG